MAAEKRKGGDKTADSPPFPPPLIKFEDYVAEQGKKEPRKGEKGK